MRYMFKFPDIGEGLEEGKIIEWYVDKGQTIESGDPLVKMETDKVVTDIPSPKNGVIVQRFGGIGDTIKVGSVLVEIEMEGIAGAEAVTEARKEIPAAHKEEVEEKGFGVVGTIEVAGDGAYLPSSGEGLYPSINVPMPAGEAPPAAQPRPALSQALPSNVKVLATPVARAIAKDLGIQISAVKGTGPAGRVTRKDIEQYHSSKTYLTDQAPGSAPSAQVAQTDRITIKPISMIRKTIARNMTRSKQNAVHMSVMDEIEITPLVEGRSRLNKSLEDKGVRLSYLPFVIKAVALSLKHHPDLNAELDLEGDRIIYKNYYNIGIAVDTDEGLVVPVIRDADQKSLVTIAAELAEIAVKAKDRKLTINDMKEGSFTITSYGSIGGYFAVPVINYPQVGILGVGRITQKPVVVGTEIKIGNVMPISMSVDHRMVDGGEASRFLNEVLSYLKDPLLLMANLGGEA